jgi:predicted transcriptional regulator of viral defense system
MRIYPSPVSTARLLRQHELFAFESRTLAAMLGLTSAQAARLLRRMQAEGLAARLERGKYLLLGLSPEEPLSNPLFIGSHLLTPAYVSFWSALHFHGFTEQVPQRVFLAVTRQKRPVVFHGVTYQFVRLPPRLFFGYRRETLGGLPLTVADEAKAIVDSLLLPRYAGGVEEVAKALRTALQEQRVESGTLIEYARRCESDSLNGRLGFLLEALGQPTDDLPPPGGPLCLDPGRPRQGEYHPRWKVYVNVPRAALFPVGVA